MNYVENVYKLAEEILHQPQYVFLNETRIEEFSEFLQNYDYPQPLKSSKSPETETLVDLVTASIDYCFWYGKSTIRPNNSSSDLLYRIVRDIFYRPDQSLKLCLEELIKTLITMRFPLLEHRIKHLKELEPRAEEFVSFVVQYHDKLCLNYMLARLVDAFPGFASDLFLKRVCLFFIQLYRKRRWFRNEMSAFLIPADYQLPKVMFSYGLISYSPALKNMIFSHQLIPKGSLQELEIRAATVLTAKKISEYSGWNVADIDTVLFAQRELVDIPFHLTVTTDY